MEHSKDLIFNKALTARQKLVSFCAGYGYTLPLLMLMLFVTGTLSFVTNRPGLFDPARFAVELSVNILFTSGLLVASVFSFYKEKKVKHSFKMLASSFSVGLVTAYYVNKGIIKSMFNKPMKWYLLNKSKDY
jgi:hypothetical protein